MTLLSCPECGEEISNRQPDIHGIKHCRYCDFAFEEEISHISQRNYKDKPNVCYIDCIPYDLTVLKDEILRLQKRGELNAAKVDEIIRDLCQTTGCMSEHSGYALVTQIKATGKVPKTFNGKIGVRTYQNRVRSDKLCCPRCGSSHVAIGHRGYSIISGFWGSNRTMNRCGMCGYRWEPRR